MTVDAPRGGGVGAALDAPCAALASVLDQLVADGGADDAERQRGLVAAGTVALLHIKVPALPGPRRRGSFARK